MPNTSIQNLMKRKIGKKTLFYVARDVERAAAGLFLNLPNYRIISNDSSYARQLATKHPNIIIIKSGKQLNTLELLDHAETKKIIKNNDLVLVFKNTVQIERICKENKWKILNPKAELASRVEEKISQIKWLGPLSKYLPEYNVDICQNIKWTGKKFILQFNRSHTGSGTVLLTNKKQLEEIKQKFPIRDARSARYIVGPLFTNNNIVWGGKVILGNINYQITGLKPFTDLEFATIGNDWALPNKILNREQISQYKKIATAVGKRLAKDGWKGLFGIDVVLEQKTGKLFLLEINARQPASTTYESELQKTNSTFEAHLASLLNIANDNFVLNKITDGAQIIQRVTKHISTIPEPQISQPCHFKCIYHGNTLPNSDLLRIQTDAGVMKAHNKLNDRGRETIDLVICAKGGNRWNAPRAGALLIKDGKILLIKRHKYGKDYFVIPGGIMEEGEDLISLAKREVLEETGLTFEPTSPDPTYLISNGRDEYYYTAKNIMGTAKLGGPESQFTFEDNSYELKWVALKDLKKINLLPKAIKKTIYDL